MCNLLIASGFPLIQRHLLPCRAACVSLKVKGRGPLHGVERAGLHMKAVRTPRVSGKGRRRQHPAMSLSRPGPAAGVGTDPAGIGDSGCSSSGEFVFVFSALNMAGSFPLVSLGNSSKLSLSRIASPPHRGSHPELGQGEQLCSVFYYNAHTSHSQPKTNSLSGGFALLSR